MKNQLDKETFYRLVRNINPYGDRVWFASITWNGIDFCEDDSERQEANNKLWDYLIKNGHAVE